MRSHNLGIFDHVIAMDSLIHYDEADIIGVLKAWSQRANEVAFTFAPATAMLRTMHFVGKAFPRGDRSPAIKPVSEARLSNDIVESLPEWSVSFTRRVSSGFYKSQAMGISRR